MQRKHKKEFIFFCQEKSCKKPICKTCLTKRHKKHDFVEIEEKKEKLLKNIENTKRDLTQKVSILSQVKDELLENTKATMNDLKKAQEETYKNFDTMMKEAETKMKVTATRLDGDVGMINENLLLLEQMKNNIAADAEVTIQGLIDGEETVTEVINTIKINICGKKTFMFKQFQANYDINYGSFKEGAITVALVEITAAHESSTPMPIVTAASELKWKGTIVNC